MRPAVTGVAVESVRLVGAATRAVGLLSDAPGGGSLRLVATTYDGQGWSSPITVTESLSSRTTTPFDLELFE